MANLKIIWNFRTSKEEMIRRHFFRWVELGRVCSTAYDLGKKGEWLKCTYAHIFARRAIVDLDGSFEQTRKKFDYSFFRWVKLGKCLFDWI